MVKIKAKEFVQGILLNEVEDILRNHPYHAFGLMTQGIEFLGACLDEHSFHHKGKSGERFRRAIKELFPTAYTPFNDEKSQYDLYKALRCGLLHVFLPKVHLELIRQKEVPQFAAHLDFWEGRGNRRLVLVAEEFFKDYQNACQKLIGKIDSGALDNEKVKQVIFVH